MKARKLIYHIFPANILVIIGVMIVLVWYGSGAIENFYMDETRSSLIARGWSIEEQVTSMLAEDDLAHLRQFIQRIGQKTSSRITVIAPTGIVLADSLKDSQLMENHINRPEIRAAMHSENGFAVRFSRTVGENLLYAAIPLEHLQGEDGATVLRLSVSVAGLESTLTTVKTKIGLGMMLVVLVAAIITMFVSRRISRPLEEMTRGAERFATGQFTPQLMAGHHVSCEIATLSQALNSMANQLQDRIMTILRQKNELQTVLDSMLAAVLTVDLDGRVISINAAAAKLLHLTTVNAATSQVEEIIRNIDILQIIHRGIAGEETIEDEISISVNSEDCFLLTNCVQLYDEKKQSVGVLLVLHDVTKIRHLENMRQDFVANVSHELKTPITSIRGYVETILDDALEDKENSLRFLETVLKKANNLDAIIDDLLVLSHIEQQDEGSKIRLSVQDLKPVLWEALHTCESRAVEKGIRLKLDCLDSLQVNMHEILLEQAVVNLIVNSITYSHENSAVQLNAERVTGDNQEQIVITVSDFGIGIGKEHLPRLFERFYRSDKARSRKLGGTGLGLAIVKHIVQAHHGTVQVQSEVGRGTSVVISLPNGHAI